MTEAPRFTKEELRLIRIMALSRYVQLTPKRIRLRASIAAKVTFAIGDAPVFESTEQVHDCAKRGAWRLLTGSSELQAMTTRAEAAPDPMHSDAHDTTTSDMRPVYVSRCPRCRSTATDRLLVASRNGVVLDPPLYEGDHFCYACSYEYRDSAT